MKTLKFKHLYGEPYKFKFEQLKPTKMSGDSPMVKGNSLYTAFIWQTGGGGEVCILQNDKPGKLSPEHPMLQGHTGSILDIDWYPFDDSFLATASMDNSIKIWQVPENFSKHITEEQSTLYGHEKKVNLIQWNQTASWLLASGSHDSVTSHSIYHPLDRQDLGCDQGRRRLHQPGQCSSTHLTRVELRRLPHRLHLE